VYGERGRRADAAAVPASKLTAEAGPTAAHDEAYDTTGTFSTGTFSTCTSGTQGTSGTPGTFVSCRTD
jgi:hypothetical protein